MIKINDKLFDDYDIKISFDNYAVCQNNKKRSGEALYIKFILGEFSFDIETTYDKRWIFELKVNDTKDILNYIVGFSYEDENGWMYLCKNDSTTCYLKRLNDREFNIKLNGVLEEDDEVFNIDIDSNFTLRTNTSINRKSKIMSNNLFNIRTCNKCALCFNQIPLLDNKTNIDIMVIGLSAKKVDDAFSSTPLQNNTNTGKIIENIELKVPKYKFYKTNLVKCLPLNINNKIRYPSVDEMTSCIPNLINEIDIMKPKIILVLGRITYNYIIKYFKNNNLDTSKIIYIEHPSYIYVYKRKYLDDYIYNVVKIIEDNI